MLQVWCQTESTLDSKGRMALPASLRNACAKEGVTSLMLSFNGKDALYAWDRPTFYNTVVSKVEGLDPFSPAVETFTYAVLSTVNECEIDAQGRILIPASLRRYAGLTKDIHINSFMDRMLISDLARWEARFQRSVHDFALADGMPKAGS